MSARPYKCSYPECYKTFKRKSDRKKHEKIVHAPPQYQCPFPGCGKMIKTNYSLKIHIQDTHSNTTSYLCSYPGCSKTYKHRSSLQRHNREGHGSNKYQCPFSNCNKTYTKKDSLSYHIKYVHNFDESLKIPCPYPGCGKSFKTKKSLNEHIRYIHSDSPRHKCPYPDCNKTYKRKSGLNEHIQLIHQGLLLHVCAKCGVSYRYLKDLKNHLKRNLCGSSYDKMKIRKEHNNAVKQLKNFLQETKSPKAFQREAGLPNGKVLDLLVRCPDNRLVGFDVTIGRSDVNNVRNAILGKFYRGYEEFCDIVYVIAISGIENALRTIRKCDKSPLKPKKTRVIHWRAIVRDNPNYEQIFQQIEDKAIL